MRVLIFGAEGIAGAALMRLMPDALGTTRREAQTGLGARLLGGIDIANRDDIERAFDWVSPSVVINCAGIVKSECDKHPESRVRAVNAIAPHEIADVASEEVGGCRVIHLSTDCVYDGSRGARMDGEPTDATDLYGKTKAQGELVFYPRCLTIRSSFIGADPTYRRGLLEWLRKEATEKSEVTGFTNMMWSGLSAAELARAIALAVAIPALSGLYHVSGPVISKADLLSVLIEAHGLHCAVRRVDEPRIDRTLDDSRFRTATGYNPPTWAEMAKELARDT